MQRFRAHLHISIETEGGQPIFSGFRLPLCYGEGNTDCRIDLENCDVAMPGKECTAMITLAVPAHLGKPLTVGAAFELRAGSRVFARGRVLSPLEDLND
jgi:hypothetical protein